MLEVFYVELRLDIANGMLTLSAVAGVLANACGFCDWCRRKNGFIQ